MAPVASPPHSFLLNVFSASLFFFSHPPLPGPSVSSSNSPTCLSSGGGEQAQLDQFLTPSFLAILRDPAGGPPSSWSTGWRLAGAKLHRLFTNTLWPAGVSKGLGLEAACSRALPIFVFSKKCIESFPFQSQSDQASSFLCSRKAMKCAKPVESNIVY